MAEISFHPIDQRAWPRGQIFYYFSQMAPTGYSLTDTVDVTRLRETMKKAGMKFFPAYLWLVTRTLQEQIEFKTALRDGVLGYYDTLTPLYAAFHPEEHTFSLMWTEFDPDFSVFYAHYLENQRQYGAVKGVLSQPGMPPENAYTVSTLPWVSFSHFAVHSYENKPYYFPSVESGKFREEAGKTLMPLSITCHHATTDGWHVAQFLDHLRQAAADFEP